MGQDGSLILISSKLGRTGQKNGFIHDTLEHDVENERESERSVE